MPKKETVNKKSQKKEWILFWMILPWILYVFVFHYMPIAGWAYAFVDYKLGKSPLQSEFVGLKNFRMLFSNISRLPRALRNTVIPNTIGLAISWLPVAFAIFLNELRSTRYRRIIQTVTTIPNFISWVMIYGLMVGLFSTDGMLNILFLRKGIISEPFNLLNNINISWTLQAVMGTWKGIGFSAIIYLAAISGIDQELYDAAMTDGAGRFRRIWHVTIPGVLPTFLVQTVLGISGFLSGGMDYPLVFGTPLTNPKLENIGLYSYNLFRDASYSYGIALGIMNSVVSIVLICLANTAAKKVRGESVV
ncbi:ABC transporter permease subunit [Acetatifactor aquisgranensis]|uniref:ABC transporter permease subunit n=1 Tax=Acetatifactor aquisgranensis TaxID=2941233 RepID=UPI00203DA43D|nr:ABC transporter permease subunit [Acetatifactor aquisgranensis]